MYKDAFFVALKAIIEIATWQKENYLVRVLHREIIQIAESALADISVELLEEYLAMLDRMADGEPAGDSSDTENRSDDTQAIQLSIFPATKSVEGE